MKSRQIYRNRNFMKLTLGNTISFYGDNMYNIALTVSLYQSTGSVSAIAFMWLIRVSMRIPIQFFAGMIADSFPRKQIIILTNLISAPIALAFLIVEGQHRIFLYILIFLLQALNDIEQPSIVGLTQELVEPEQLKDANALTSFLAEISAFTAPGLAGAIMLFWRVPAIFLLNALSFLVAGVILSAIRYQSVIEKKKKSEFTLFAFAKEGFRYVLGKRELMLFLGFGILPGMMGRYYEIYKVHVADVNLNIGPEGIVFFSYAMGIGSVLTPPIVKAFLKNKTFTPSFYFASVLAVSAALTLWGITTNPLLSFPALAFSAFVFTLLGIVLNTYLQENVDSTIIGRVYSLYRILMILGALIGILAAPWLLNLWNAGLGFLIAFGVALTVFVGYRLSRRGKCLD